MVKMTPLARKCLVEYPEFREMVGQFIAGKLQSYKTTFSRFCYLYSADDETTIKVTQSLITREAYVRVCEYKNHITSE